MRFTHLAVFRMTFRFKNFVKESGKQLLLNYNSHAKRSKIVKELKKPFPKSSQVLWLRPHSSNKIEAMREWFWMVARKSWTSLNFTYKLNTLYPASILLRQVKISCVHKHVKVTRKWKPTLNLSTGITFSEISPSVHRVKRAKYFAYVHNILLTYMVNRRLVSSV